MIFTWDETRKSYNSTKPTTRYELYIDKNKKIILDEIYSLAGIDNKDEGYTQDFTMGDINKPSETSNFQTINERIKINVDGEYETKRSDRSLRITDNGNTLTYLKNGEVGITESGNNMVFTWNSNKNSYNLVEKTNRIEISIEENKQIIFEETTLDSNGNDDKAAGYSKYSGLGLIKEPSDYEIINSRIRIIKDDEFGTAQSDRKLLIQQKGMELHYLKQGKLGVTGSGENMIFTWDPKQRNYNLPVKNARIVITIEENKQIIFEEIALDSNGNDDKNAGYKRVTELGTVRGLIEERTVTVFPPNTNVYYPTEV